MTRKRLSKPLFIAITAIVAFLAVQILWLFGVFGLVENTLRDIRFRNRGQELPPANIVLVDFPNWRSDKRKEVAEVVRALGQGGAKGIILDILLDQSWDAEGDIALSEAIRDTPGVILAMQIEPKSESTITVSEPLDKFKLFAWGVGFVNLITDPDDRIVREALLIAEGSQEYPSIMCLAMARYIGVESSSNVHGAWNGVKIGNNLVKTTPRNTMIINYFGGSDVYNPETGSSRVYTDDLVRNLAELGMLTPDVSPFKDKIVIVGSTSPHTKDMHRIPFDAFVSESARTPGMIVQANILGNLLSPQRYIPDYRYLQSLFAIIIALLISTLFVLISSRFPVWVSSIIAVGIVIVGVLIQFYSFPAAALSLLPSIATVPICYMGGIYYHALEAKSGKDMMRDLFGYYLSHDLAGAILEDPTLIRMGGYEARCTFLICDIDRFSTLSESLDPTGLVEFLNIFFSEMHTAVKAYKGWLNKYLGDGLLVVYGAPIEDVQHADNAVATAIDMRNRMSRLKELIAERFGIKDFSATIGIHTGEACIGNIGSPDRMEYTVIGDAVNVCQRIMAKAKEEGVEVILSQEVKDSLHYEPRCDEIGTFPVKGRTQPVVMYKLN